MSEEMPPDGSDAPPPAGPDTPQPPDPPAQMPEGAASARVSELPPMADRFSTYSRGMRFPVREMGVGEILDAAVNLYKVHWKTLMAISAFILVPFNFLQSFFGREMTPSFDFSGQPPETLPTGAFVSTIVFTVLLALVVQPFLTAATAKATAEVYLGGEPTVADTYRFALSRVHTILWVSILYGFTVVGGFLLLIVGAVVFALRFILGTTLVVTEGLKGTKALGRAWRLSKGFFWKIFGMVILAGILTYIVGLIFQLPFQLIGLALGSSGWPLQAIGASLSGVIATPFYTVIVVLLYFDLRIRKEGLDLELMAREIETVPR